MGYTTDFEGAILFDRPLSQSHYNYLCMFSDTRRMQRDPEKLPDDPVCEAVGLLPGEQGQYFVGGLGVYGQDKDSSIINYNRPPEGQPSLWCGWKPTGNRDAISWDGTQKFYSYVEWMLYIRDHFLHPWGYVLSGEISWQGEDPEDKGIILANNSVLTIIVNPNEEEETITRYPVTFLIEGVSEKPSVVIGGDIYQLIRAIIAAWIERGREDIAIEYENRIRDVEPEIFFTITGDYIEL